MALLYTVKVLDARNSVLRYTTDTPKVHLMHLGPKISGVELIFLLAWRRGNRICYAPWRTDVVKCESLCTVLSIFASQVYASLQRWVPFEELLPFLRREFYTELIGLHGPKSEHICKCLEFPRIFSLFRGTGNLSQ